MSSLVTVTSKYHLTNKPPCLLFNYDSYYTTNQQETKTPFTHP